MCIRSKSFLVLYEGSFKYKTVLSKTRNSLTSFFPSVIVLMSFSCLISLADAQSAILNKRGLRRHPCFITNFRRNFLSTFFPLGIMLAICLLHSLYF